MQSKRFLNPNSAVTSQQEELIQISYLELFAEENWHQCFSRKYLIKARTFELDEEDTQFLIDDCTSPDLTKFKINQKLSDAIQNDFNGSAFLKIYGRTAKDINFIMSKIQTIKDFIMAVKMSEFLSEALDQELQFQRKALKQSKIQRIKLKITLREYKDYLQTAQNQFRTYFLNDKLVGMCQKIPNHISCNPNESQIIKAKQIGKVVYSWIQKYFKYEMQSHGPVKLVLDCYIEESGSKTKILSIEPIKPLHCLSLFAEEELQKSYQLATKYLNQGQTITPLLRYIKSEHQYKEIDLSYYHIGWELTSAEALHQWKEFIQEK